MELFFFSVVVLHQIVRNVSGCLLGGGGWVGGGYQKKNTVYICADHVEWYTLCVLFQYRVVIEVQ